MTEEDEDKAAGAGPAVVWVVVWVAPAAAGRREEEKDEKRSLALPKYAEIRCLAIEQDLICAETVWLKRSSET